MNISSFKFFNGIKKTIISPPREEVIPPLNERWSWINQPTISTLNFDDETGDLVTNRYDVRNFYCTFSEFVRIALDNRLIYIFDIKMVLNNTYHPIPHGTGLNEMGIYDWSGNFRILAILI